MSITEQQLQSIMPNARRQAGVFVSALNTAMKHYQIVGPKRAAAFLAQIGHESGQLRYVREIWGPTAVQRGYEGRADLGNTVPGDGRKYCGRGLVQITGRANYAKCGEALGLDLISHPELLELPQHAAMSAAWFWKQKGLNDLADRDEFNTITRRVNGGLNGLADRLALWKKAREVLA
ncbi:MULTISPECIES: glycoside hydrolase family 19 protein [Pseudomonas]|uniref:glycoside hydrolase family 19 protein n=1 Tax=Pseudomonas TaxID=286 RepID=UPI00059E6373|nr:MULTISPECIES: glycoside hydrolase family 19 protein [Pseudomonas]AMT88907.1 chitinase [Pseudomonas koreensis]MBB4055066.1 putative chitinase [Pseudomonas koreensis]QDR24497.1 glycosidase lys177 [Pseudomonas sp.]TSB49276.1 glycoside hydrolase family 19 protein [Pseudomonas sp. ef1]